MMKHDPSYDEKDVRRFGLGGLDDEVKYNQLVKYSNLFVQASKWINIVK